MRFSEKHPNVRFTILSRISTEILSMLENLDVDAGISYLDNEPTGRVSTELLYEERYMLVCASGSPFAARASVEWEELDGQRLCLLTPGTQNRRIINKNFAAVGIMPEAIIESDSAIVMVANAETGRWLTVLPEDMARFLANGKSVRLIPLSGAEPSHTVGLIAPYREPHTPVLSALLSEARQMSALKG
jgi:DNA-binding transcriptional LysR family regulator